MIFIAHRRNTLEELNTTPVEYGIEVDIRSRGENLIIHHDALVPGGDFLEWIAAYRHGTLILNVKEEGLEARLLSVMDSHGITDFFFLDQSFPFLVKWAKAGEQRCAVRVSEFESIDTALSLAGKVDWVWVDCFTRFPLSGDEARRLQDAGFRLCIVSPELQGRNAETEIPAYAALLTERGIAACRMHQAPRSLENRTWPAMKTLLVHPLFLIGIAIRLAIVAGAISQPVVDWYAPFLSTSVSQWNMDPWGVWLAHGGSPAAFPYGYVMWLLFLPLTLLGKLVGMAPEHAYALTLGLVDVALLAVLRRLLPGRDRMLLLVYWFSPITLVATYWLGYNDLVPVALLTLTLYCIRHQKNWTAGLALAAAISAKLSMAAALPFFLIYFQHNRPHRKFLPDFAKAFALGATLFSCRSSCYPATGWP